MYKALGRLRKFLKRKFKLYETKIGQISHCGLVPILTGTPPWSTSGEDIMPISSKWDTLKNKIMQNYTKLDNLD